MVQRVQVHRRCRASRTLRCRIAPACGVELRVHQVRARRARRRPAARGSAARGRPPGPSRPPPMTTARSVRRGRSAIIAAGVVDACGTRRRPGESCAVGGAHAVHRRDERPAAGGEDQLVVRGDRAVVGVHHLGEAVDPGDPHAGAQLDVVVGVPVSGVEEDLVLVLAPGQHVGQQDPVVVAVRLVAEHGDRELLGAAALEDLLDRTGAGHAVADHHQPARPSGRASASSARCSSCDSERRPGRRSHLHQPEVDHDRAADPSGAARYSSTTVPPSRSSTTRSGTCTSAFAPIGK